MSIHGPDRTFRTPAELRDMFNAYKEWAAERPWNRVDFVRGGEAAGTLVKLPTERPYTLWDFAAFCGVSYDTLYNYGNDDRYSEYHAEYAKINTEIKAQQLGGATAGAYNANLVSRLNNLADKSELDVKADIADVLSAARRRAGLE
jgi:hypothetical protein